MTDTRRWHTIEVRQLDTSGRTVRTFTYHTNDVAGKLDRIRRAFNMEHTSVTVDGIPLST